MGRAIAVPSQLRSIVSASFHYAPALGGGHRGGNQLYDAIRSSFYWNGMERACHAFTETCHKCGSTRSQARVPIGLGISATPSLPFEVIHLDHKGPLTRVEGYSHVLVVACALTRFVLYIPVRTTTAEETLRVLEERVFCIFGPPLVIISDNGKAFANALMTASETVYGYRRIFVKPASPQSNGLAEAAVKRLKLLIDRHTSLHANWPSQIPLFQLLLNSRTHSAHGVSPFVALFGRTPYTLPALENPALISVSDDGNQFVKDRVVRLRQLSARLKQESDNVKRAAQLAHEEKHPPRAHNICVQ